MFCDEINNDILSAEVLRALERCLINKNGNYLNIIWKSNRCFGHWGYPFLRSLWYILVVLGLRKLAEMELYIETLTGTFFELRVSPFETIMSVKAKIQRLEGKLSCATGTMSIMSKYKLIKLLLSIMSTGWSRPSK